MQILQKLAIQFVFIFVIRIHNSMDISDVSAVVDAVCELLLILELSND